MAINFPSTPVLDQIYTLDKASWKYSGTAWVPQGSVLPKTTVVSEPAFLMPNQALNSQTVVLKARATSLLAGTSISSFRLTTPNGTTTTVAANADGTASVSFIATGTTGTALTVLAQATDSWGNNSKEVGYTVTIGTAFVNKAAITSPVNEATLVENGLTITTAAFGATGASDILNRSEFEVRTAAAGSGTLIWSGSVDELLSVVVPDDTIAAGATVFVRARHVGNTLGIGQWSDDVQITAAPVLTPAKFGDPYQGGFYGGRIQQGDNWYAIVVSPLSQETSLASANTTGGLLNTEAKSIDDGWSNTNEIMSNSSTFWPAAAYCHNLVYAGYSDWYLPSVMELELLYRTLKPTTSINATTQIVLSGAVSGTSGYGNSTSNVSQWPATTVPARTGTNYTNSALATSPAITSAVSFQGAGVIEGFFSATYWTSSSPGAFTANRENMAHFDFSSGAVIGSASNTGDALLTTTVRRVRPIRRVFLRSAV